MIFLFPVWVYWYIYLHPFPLFHETQFTQFLTKPNLDLTGLKHLIQLLNTVYLTLIVHLATMFIQFHLKNYVYIVKCEMCFFFLLIDLSQRLKSAFLIICPLSVVVVCRCCWRWCCSCCKLLAFHLLLKNNWVIFNQTWYKAS